MTNRVTFVEAGDAARAANRRANQLKLTVRDRKVLAAVLDLTSTYSKVADHVYLAQVAAVAFGVDEAQPWMCEKTRKALRVLHDAGVVFSRAPKGRSWGRQYVISLVPLDQVTQPEPGPTDRPVTQPEDGPSETGNTAQDRAESEAVTQPDSGWVTQPEPGGPTEKTSEVPTSPQTVTHEGRGPIGDGKGPITPKRILSEMARRKLLIGRRIRASWAPEEGCHPSREKGFLKAEFEALQAQHGFELDQLIARFHPDHPAKPKHADPEWYVWRLDRDLSYGDWSVPSVEETRAKLEAERAERAAQDPDKVDAARQQAIEWGQRYRAARERQKESA
jgi:hypothetical protein